MISRGALVTGAVAVAMVVALNKTKPELLYGEQGFFDSILNIFR